MNTSDYQLKRLEKRLRRKTGEAIRDFNMIEEGDTVMVCLSGGKDLPNYLDEVAIEYHIEEQDTYSIVMDKIPEGRTLCSLCSRLRRGILYRVAEEHRATKIALGHHMDDMVETLFLNMFHGSRMKSMPPKLISDNKNNIVIRPLAYCREKDLAKYAVKRKYPIIPCNLCGSQDNLERVKIKQMLRAWEKEAPNRVVSIFKSMHRITPTHLFDRSLYDFTNMHVGQTELPDELDTAFDRESAKQQPEQQPEHQVGKW